MNKRSGFQVMRRLIGLVRPLTGYMLLAIAMGLIGHLCAAFITVAGGLAVNICGGDRILADIGTNGEMLFHFGEKFWAASTAAGPCFEGANIECGTGAAHVYGDFEGRFGRPPEQKDFVVSRRCQKPCELTITSHDLTPLMAQIGENSLVDFETSTSGADGDPVWYRYQSVVLYDEEGGPVRHVGRLLDTSEAAMRESQFRRKAERDSLTGLYNRAAALDRIETALRTESRPCTLIVVDVDDFKAVNDSYGHPEGDYVLKRLAIFLSQVMRKEDIVARIGGDEFLIFAPGLGSGPAADRVLEHLARGPFAGQRATDEVTDTAYHAAPTISVGAACCLTPPMPFDVLYAAADSTLYQVKEAGKAQYLLTVIG